MNGSPPKVSRRKSPEATRCGRSIPKIFTGSAYSSQRPKPIGCGRSIPEIFTGSAYGAQRPKPIGCGRLIPEIFTGSAYGSQRPKPQQPLIFKSKLLYHLVNMLAIFWDFDPFHSVWCVSGMYRFRYLKRKIYCINFFLSGEHPAFFIM